MTKQDKKKAEGPGMCPGRNKCPSGTSLMYLTGIDLYEKLKVTGHTTPTMRKKYIKGIDASVLLDI